MSVSRHGTGKVRAPLRWLGAVVAGLWLTGCTTVGPDYEPPEPVAVDLAADPGDVGFAISTDRHWWTGFDDPVLTGLVDAALRGNLDIQAAGARVREARVRFDQAVLDALLEISDALAVRREALNRAEALVRARTAAASAARGLEGRYQAGAEPLLSVLDAQSAVFDASDAEIVARVEAVLALVGGPVQGHCGCTGRCGRL